MMTWFTEIMEDVSEKKKSKQRRSRTYKNRRNESRNLVDVMDVTHTHSQTKYSNVSAESVVENVLFSGSGVASFCFMSEQLVTEKANDQFEVLFRPRDTEITERAYEGLRQDFIEAFRSETPDRLKKFSERVLNDDSLKSYFKGEGILRVKKNILNDARVRFLASVFIPRAVWEQLRPNFRASSKDVMNLIGLIRDNTLRSTLRDATKSTQGAEKVINKFMNNRVSSVGPDLPEEVLQSVGGHFETQDLNAESSINKCALTLFHSVQKALKAKPARSAKGVSLPPGIDRRLLPPEYMALVRPERAKLALRIAVGAYTSGLSLIRKGFKENNMQYIYRGYAKIFNVRNAEFQSKKKKKKKQKYKLAEVCPLLNGETFPYCDEFRQKTSAASALLLAYMELTDYFVDPSPPLICQNDFRVTEFYVNPDTEKDRLEMYDVSTYASWTRHKKRTFRGAYERFRRQWMNVGFVETSEVGPHGMRLLNFGDWGRPGQVVVPNPLRVREDTYCFKLLGGFRLEPNRLGIGEEARRVWINHEIRRGYDPRYCQLFRDRMKSYPRPIADPGEATELYVNISSWSLPCVSATRLREAWNKQGFKSYVRALGGDLSDAQGNVEDEDRETISVSLSAASKAMYDIHTHFQKTDRSLQMPLQDGEQIQGVMAASVLGDWLLYVPGAGNQGIQENPDGWKKWRSLDRDSELAKPFRRNPFSIFETGWSALPEVSRRTTERAPGLFNRLRHPVTQTEIPIQFFGSVQSSQSSQSSTRDQQFPLDETQFSTGPRPQTLENEVNESVGLPVWFVTDFGVYPNDIEFPYPLKTRSGVLDATVVPIGASLNADGGPPYMLSMSSIDILLPDGPQFWDLRNSLVQLLDTEDLFKNLDRAQKALLEFSR